MSNRLRQNPLTQKQINAIFPCSTQPKDCMKRKDTMYLEAPKKGQGDSLLLEFYNGTELGIDVGFREPEDLDPGSQKNEEIE